MFHVRLPIMLFKANVYILGSLPFEAPQTENFLYVALGCSRKLYVAEVGRFMYITHLFHFLHIVLTFLLLLNAMTNPKSCTERRIPFLFEGFDYFKLDESIFRRETGDHE